MIDVQRELLKLWHVSCSQDALPYPRVMGHKPLAARYQYRVLSRSLNGNFQNVLKTTDRAAALELHAKVEGSWVEMWDMLTEERWAETGRASKDTLALVGIIRRELGLSQYGTRERRQLLLQFDAIYRTAFLPDVDRSLQRDVVEKPFSRLVKGMPI